jgi:hypothetical protein
MDDFALQIDQAFADPRTVLDKVMEIIGSNFNNLTVRYYTVKGNVAASIMMDGVPGPGQRNFMPTVHVVIGRTHSMITWGDSADEDMGNVATVHADAEAISRIIIKALQNVGRQEPYAYDLDDTGPTDADLQAISHSLDPHADGGDDGW